MLHKIRKYSGYLLGFCCLTLLLTACAAGYYGTPTAGSATMVKHGQEE